MSGSSAEVVETSPGHYRARCLTCDKTIAVGHDRQTMQEWCRTHHRLEHGPQQ